MRAFRPSGEISNAFANSSASSAVIVPAAGSLSRLGRMAWLRWRLFSSQLSSPIWTRLTSPGYRVGASERSPFPMLKWNRRAMPDAHSHAVRRPILRRSDQITITGSCRPCQLHARIYDRRNDRMVDRPEALATEHNSVSVHHYCFPCIKSVGWIHGKTSKTDRR